MIDKDVVDTIENLVSKHIGKMKNISDFIFKNPELGGEEYISCRYLSDIMNELGFEVTEKYCDLETSFLAELDNGEGPVLGIIVEYDALPGFGPDGSAAHACGHNWISAVGVGTAMIISDMKDMFSGKLRVIGTPAMENLGCKAEMIKEHAFDDVDIVIQPHLEHYTTVYSKFLAMDAMEFRFKGRASHAASSPEEGINALDAVQFMFAGMNALRQYVKPEVKIHGIICDGGETPSTIPDTASCKFYIRANTRKYLEEIKPKIMRCAEGAAMMAGAEVDISYFENQYDNMLNTPVLQELALKYMGKEGIELSENYEAVGGMSSSDIGNVSHVCPTLYMEFAMDAEGRCKVHDKTALEYVNSEFAAEKLMKVSKIMSEILMELFGDSELVKNVKKEHNKVLRENIVGKS